MKQWELSKDLKEIVSKSIDNIKEKEKNAIKLMIIEWKILTKAFLNHEGNKRNCNLVIVCKNSFGVFIEIENFRENNNKIIKN